MRRLLLVAALVCSALTTLTATPARADEDPSDPLDETPALLSATPAQLDWSQPSSNADDSADLQWDLTRLDRDGLRSDLVTIDLGHVEGPGDLTVSATSPFGERVVLLDSASGSDRTVLQVGARGSFRWEFSEPGTYEVEVAASAPTTDGGRLRSEATLRFDRAPARTGGTAPPAQTPRTEPEQTTPTSTPAAPAAASPGTRTAPARPEVPAQDEATGVEAAGDRVVIDDGHVDLGPRIVDGTWRVQLKDDTVTPRAWRDLADVVIHLRDEAIVEVPSGPAFSFLGAAGTPVHLAPQTQQPGIVWPGWNSQDPSVISAVPGGVTWTLTSVDGPGQFFLFVTDSFGGNEIYFDSTRSMPQQLDIPRNSHVHGNWAFTEPGIYRLTTQMSATSSGGAPLSDTRVLTIAVGDAVDPGTAFTPDTGGSGTPVPDDPDDDGTGDGSSMDISVSTDSPTPTGRGGGSPLATTGAARIPLLAAVGALLLIVGASAVRAAARRNIRIENRS